MAKLITLTRECEEVLDTWKEQDPNFNFSKFVQDAILGDDTLLTKEQLDLKIKIAKLEAEKAQAELTHLLKVAPVIKEKAEVLAEKAEERLKSSLETLRRVFTKKGEKRFLEILPFHTKITGIEEGKLERIARDIS